MGLLFLSLSIVVTISHILYKLLQFYNFCKVSSKETSPDGSLHDFRQLISFEFQSYQFMPNNFSCIIKINNLNILSHGSGYNIYGKNSNLIPLLSVSDGTNRARQHFFESKHSLRTEHLQQKNLLLDPVLSTTDPFSVALTSILLKVVIEYKKCYFCDNFFTLL